MKHVFSKRLRIVLLLKSGMSILDVSRAFSIHPKTLYNWVRKYDYYGEDGLKPHPIIMATGSLKAELVCQYLEKGVPLYQIVVESGVGRSSLERWIHLVRHHGYQILYPQKQRVRPRQASMARPKKKEPQTALEKQQAENERLRAEVALLKKSRDLNAGKRSSSTSDWAEAINTLRSEHRLELLLGLRQMARSVYYYHHKRFGCADKYAVEKELIYTIFHEHKGRYGYRRITAEMRNRGFCSITIQCCV